MGINLVDYYLDELWTIDGTRKLADDIFLSLSDAKVLILDEVCDKVYILEDTLKEY